MHPNLLSITLGPTHRGRDDDQRVLGDEVAYASLGFLPLVGRVRLEFEFQRYAAERNAQEEEEKEERELMG